MVDIYRSVSPEELRGQLESTELSLVEALKHTTDCTVTNQELCYRMKDSGHGCLSAPMKDIRSAQNHAEQDADKDVEGVD